MKKLTTLLIATVALLTSAAYAQTGCGPDWNGYVAWKDVTAGTDYQELDNDGLDTREVAQAYLYSGPGVLTSVQFNYRRYSFYSGAWAKVGVYHVDGNNKPTGSPIVESGTYWLAPTWSGQTAQIGLPSTYIDHDFAIVVTRQSSNEMWIEHTDEPTNAEDLASYRNDGGNWESVTHNGDFYIVPRMVNENNTMFTASDVCAGVGQTINFTNQSDFSMDAMFNLIDLSGSGSTEDHYFWDFGDGNTSTSENPSHAYAGSGSYTVTLTTTIDDWTGQPCQNTYSMNVSVGLEVTAVVTDGSCFGSNDGQLDLTGAGGAGSYQYSLNGITWQPNADFPGLVAGDHAIYVQDALGCSVSGGIINVSEPTEVVINGMGLTSATCGNSDGGFTAIAVGGDGTLTYSLDGTSWQANGGFTNLSSGIHDYYVQDGANSCVYDFSVVVPNTSAPTLTLQSYTTIACYGENNGTITITGSGGTGALQYSIDGTTFQGTGVFTGLAAGTYYPTVQDAAGCIGTIEPVVITQPELIKWNATEVPTLCNGSSDGQINIGPVIGGIGTITFSIDGGTSWQESTNFSGLSAGTYTVMVQDGTGCSSSSTVTVTEPTPIAVSIDAVTNLSCFESGDGAVLVSATGGTPDYDYKLENWDFQSVGEFTGLSAGTYTVTVSDDNHCSATTSVTINEPSEITATITSGNSTCGNANGNLLVVAAGGSGTGYSYDLNEGMDVNMTGAFAGLAADEYGILVTDGNGCEAFFGATVTDSDGPTIDASTSTDVTCNGGSDGTITITAVSGGTGIIQYSVDGEAFSTNSSFTGLFAGTHVVTVKDAAGCTGEIEITLTEPAGMVINLTGTDISCNGGNNGEIVVAAGGGAGTLAYSLNGLAYQSQSNFTGLSANTYTVFVKDAGQCMASASITLNEPPAVELYTGSTNVTCNGLTDGAIIATANGGTGTIEFSIDGVNYQPSGAFGNLSAGTYTIFAQDLNGCIEATTVTITEPVGLDLNATVSDVSCAGGNNGVIDLTVTGGTQPYSFSWFGGHFFNTEDIFNLDGGSYSVTVTDANGCTISNAYTVDEPSSPIIVNGTVTNASSAAAADGLIDLTITGGTPPYTYDWDNGSISEDLNSLLPGVYVVEVTDAAGCSNSAYFTVSYFVGLTEMGEDATLLVYPNPAKDFFNVESSEVAAKVELVDMTGKTVYVDQPNSNNFKIGVSAFSEGVYFLNIHSENGMTTMRVIVRR